MKIAFQSNSKQYSKVDKFISTLKKQIEKEEKSNKTKAGLNYFYRQCIKSINTILRNSVRRFYSSLLFDDRTALLDIRTLLQNKIKSLEVI